MPEVVDLRCPGCNAPIDYNSAQCAYCGSPITVTSFSSAAHVAAPDLMKLRRALANEQAQSPDNADVSKSLGIVFLAQGVYDKARENLSRAIDLGFDDSEVYYYTAIATLGGKKPYMVGRPTNERAKQYLETACMLEPRGIYYYLAAYINYDFYTRKHLRTNPDYKQCLADACAYGVSPAEVTELFTMLKQEMPAELAL